ncbi:hypothetical protein RIVM261_032720 [Rivularia sp. IAM M-261]|nr:hypothetical protein CAL7716_092590 [Calothrix sp. PCC 7716]GJD18316.1 hypothetical protein RIVM261_032720 [Rivularia sp. IAM M-261]
MLTFIKDYLVPIFTIVINGILAYFINQLPSIRPGSEKGIIGLPDTLIFVFTAFCVAALCVNMDNLKEQIYDVSNPLDLMLEERVRAAFLVQRRRNLGEISASA